MLAPGLPFSSEHFHLLVTSQITKKKKHSFFSLLLRKTRRTRKVRIFKMGSLGEEAFEKLVIDYMEPPVIASDDLEKPIRVLITLQVYTYSHPFFQCIFISLFCIKFNNYIYRMFLEQKEKKRRILKRR